MNDLRLYHNLKDEISELKAEIVRLELRVSRELNNKSKIKCKYDKLYLKHVGKPVTRSDIARGLLQDKRDGRNEMSLIAIAKKVHLSYATIRSLYPTIKLSTLPVP